MRLTAVQLTTIEQLVYNEVQYQETYLEVYDHMITALENEHQITDIQKAYADLLEEDFGGHSGLAKLEERKQQMIFSEINGARWKLFWYFFKWPVLPLTLLAIAGAYYLANFENFAVTTGLVVIGAALIPWIFITMANFIIGLKSAYVKRSIRDKAINHMASYMFMLYWKINVYGFLFNLFLKYTGIISSYHISLPLTIACSFVFCTLQTVSILKVYHIEYKKLITKWY